MDPGTGLTVLGTAFGSAKVLEKLLGPTADYIGGGLKDWTAKRVDNTKRIFEKAEEKLGAKIEEPGTVPPKVLKEVLAEGSYCDDELTAEYYGGVLASSRTGTTRDDRAASYLKSVSELSSYQLRFHFLAYVAIRKLFEGSALRPNFGQDLRPAATFLPASDLFAGMAFEENEPAEEILTHCVTGLDRLNLITSFHWGSQEHINASNRDLAWCEVTESGVCISPTAYGMDLWLWGLGAGQLPRSEFYSRDITLPRYPDIVLPKNAIALVSSNSP